MADRDNSTAPKAARRQWLWWAAAGVAGLAGAGVSLRHSAGASVADPVPDFWAQHWQTPDARAVSMSQFRGRPVVLNFWATWCPPCVEELPLLNAFYKSQGASGVQVLALAVDRPEAVAAFLKKMPLDFPVAMAGLGGADLGRALGNLTGGLPFSVLVASDGVVAQRKMGRLTAEDLLAWAAVK